MSIYEGTISFASNFPAGLLLACRMGDCQHCCKGLRMGLQALRAHVHWLPTRLGWKSWAGTLVDVLHRMLTGYLAWQLQQTGAWHHALW